MPRSTFRLPLSRLAGSGLLALVALAAQAGPALASDPRLPAWLTQPTQPLRWGEWEYLQVVPREPGSVPNAQPARLTAETVAAALAAAETTDDPAVRLVSDDEIARLAPAVAAALGKLGPDQELVFLTTGNHNESAFGLIGKKWANTGRLFVAGGKLNLIVGAQQSTALQRLRPGMRPERLPNGSRAAAQAGVALVPAKDSGAERLRADWLTYPLDLAAAAATPQSAASAVRSPAPPATAAATPAATRTAPESRAEDEAAPLAKRLRVLKSLHEQGLLSDREYAEKRDQILQSL